MLALAGLIWRAFEDVAVPPVVEPSGSGAPTAATALDRDSGSVAPRPHVRVAARSDDDAGDAQSEPDSSPAAAPPATASPCHENLPEDPAAIDELVGRVLLFPERSPIEGALVRVSGGDPGRPSPPLPSPDRVTTGPNGVFRIAGFAPGTYALDVTWAGRAPRQLHVAFTAGEPSDEVEVLFGAGGNVAGCVETAEGPAAGLGVRIDPSGYSAGRGLLTCTTDAAGAYRFDDLPPGSYHVTVSGSDARTQRSASVTVVAGETARLDFRSTTFVAGVVRWDGVPLSGAIVRVRRTGTEYRSEQSRSTADGSFRVDGLEPGEHVLSVQVLDAPGFAVDVLRTELQPDGNHIDLLLGQTDAAGSVSGRLMTTVALAAPLSRAQITICAMTEKAADAWEAGGQVAMAFPDANGRFRVLGLRAGRYDLRVQPMGIGVKSTSVEFTLEHGERKDGLEIRLEAREPRERPPSAALLTGVVTDGGRPLGEAHVRAISVAAGGRSREARTDGTGHFVLDHLTPGTWWLHVQVLGAGGFSAEVAETEIAEGKNTIELRLGEGELAGEIRGRVTARVSGAPLTSKDVDLWLSARDGDRVVRHAGLTSSDDSGVFRFRCVRGGAYRIVATPRGGSLRTCEVDVDVVSGRVLEGVDVALDEMQTGAVRFVLRTEDGTPVRRAKILSMQDGRPRQGSVTSNSGSGVYETHFEIGTHHVALSDWYDNFHADVTVEVREGETTVVDATLRPVGE